MAMRSVSGSFDNALNAYTTENDPLLVKEAMPSTLKLIEVLLTSSPDNPNLLITASSAYTMYAHGFLMEEADRLERNDLTRARELHSRSKNLYLRARDYGLRALEIQYPNFRQQIRNNTAETLEQLNREDVPVLYWTSAAWASAISVDPQDYSLVPHLPVVEQMIRRALALDESWGDGRLHEFMISFEAGRVGMGGSIEAAEQHFQRAKELSNGSSASLYVTAAEALAVRNQNRDRFRNLLESALGIDPDQHMENRLMIVIAQERAEWLLENIDYYFL